MTSSTDSERLFTSIASGLDVVTSLSSKNEEMRHCLDLARVASKSSAPVMITGESGVGKTLLAMAIHHGSPKRARPCVTLNCASVRERDIKNRLFGVGALHCLQGDEDVGLIVKAKGGTLIIDAVDLLPGFIQKELLNILMDKSRTGDAGRSHGPLLRHIDARIIATSGSELAQKAASGLFVEELLYCLGEITIRIPPLRERREDLPELTRMAIQAANRANSKEVAGLSRTASDFIAHYDFPGNVRELFLIINRAVKGTSRESIYVEDLGLVVDAIEEDPHLFSDMTLLPLAEMEKRHINKALLRTGWKSRAAARILRISETMLERKIRLYGLERGNHPD